MIIRDIKNIKNEKLVTLSANIQFGGNKFERMFFSTDSKNDKYVSTDASPFLAAVLLPCMKINEDIFIEGSISAKLLKNTEVIMNLVSAWDKKFKKIKISAEKVIDDKLNPKNTACFFSAGVDSFYTFLKHENEIDDFVLVQGFDISLKNPSFFSEVKKPVEDISKQEEVNLVTVSTNVKDIIEKRLVWDFAHGGAMAAVGLFLRNNIKTLYIAGAVRKDELFPYGTHPELDKLWSTETIGFIHDGTEYNRFEKIINSISKSPLALKNLRVCTQNIKGKYNCSKCYKCLITMIYLECAGALSKSETFDKKLDLNLVKNMYYNYDLLYNKQGEMSLNYLKKHNINPELQEAIAKALEKSKHPGLVRKISGDIARFDQKYNNRRLYRYIFSPNKDGDRNWIFKFLLGKKVFK